MDSRLSVDTPASTLSEQGELSQNHVTYFCCLYNQETKLLLNTEAGKPPECTVAINEWLETVTIVVNHDDETKETKIPASNLRYVKVIQAKEVLLSWYESDRIADHTKKWAWLTFQLSETEAVDVFVGIIQKLAQQARPGLGTVLTFEGCGNIEASIEKAGSSKLAFDTYFFVVDKEVVALFKDTLEQCQAALHFYKEPGDVAIEQVLSRKDLGQCEIKSPTQHLVFKLESVGANILLESIRKCKPVPKEWFRNDKALSDYLAEIEVQRHMASVTGRVSTLSTAAEGAARPGLEDEAVSLESYQFDHLIGSLNTDHIAPSDDQLSVMWAAIEADIRDMISGGLVPGSSISSGGLDPNSCEHFVKCVDEIQDALFEEKFPRAVSILRGAKEVFSKCKYPVVKEFLDKDELEILKRIYFRNK